MNFYKTKFLVIIMETIVLLFFVPHASRSQPLEDLRKDNFDITLVKEDGKGKMVLACNVFPGLALKCDSLETRISFPKDLFTTQYEKAWQKLKNGLDSMSDSELVKEIPNGVEVLVGNMCKDISSFNDFSNHPTPNKAISVASHLKDLCANKPKPKESPRQWMLEFINVFDSLPIKSRDTCGIFTMRRDLDFQHIGNEKWSYTLKSRWGPLCPFVKYYELTMGENKKTWTLHETLLSLNLKSKTCQKKEEDLLKPQAWSSNSSGIIKLPCEKVDWEKLPVD